MQDTASKTVVGFDGANGSVAIGEIKDGLLHVTLHDGETGDEVVVAGKENAQFARRLFRHQIKSGAINHDLLAPEIRDSILFEIEVLRLALSDADPYAAPEVKLDRAFMQAAASAEAGGYSMPAVVDRGLLFTEYLHALELEHGGRNIAKERDDEMERLGKEQDRQFAGRQPTPFVDEPVDDEEVVMTEAEIKDHARQQHSESVGYNQAISDIATDHGFKTEAGKLLSDAAKTIAGGRMDEYGKPERNAENIAEYFSTYLTTRLPKIMDQLTGVITLEGSDVAALNVLQKVARQSNAPKRDNWLDIAGYAGIGAQCDEQRKNSQLAQQFLEDIA